MEKQTSCKYTLIRLKSTDYPDHGARVINTVPAGPVSIIYRIVNGPAACICIYEQASVFDNTSIMRYPRRLDRFASSCIAGPYADTRHE